MEKQRNLNCDFCCHRCSLDDGEFGKCLVNYRDGDKIVCNEYGKTPCTHYDPIEKRPLHHFLPGSRTFAMCTVGCNMTCKFCQNADISQALVDKNDWVPKRDLSPEDAVEMALHRNVESLAFTFTEPTVAYPYMLDTFKLAKENGLYTVMITNGYITPERLDELAPYLDTANVDLKAFSDKYYREMCGASVFPVLKTIEKMRELGIWVEVSTLFVNGENDSEDSMRDIAEWLCDVDPNIPWHVNAGVALYKLLYTHVHTPPKTVDKAYKIGYGAGLRYVYVTNTDRDPRQKTRCHNCGYVVIDRDHFDIHGIHMDGQRCEGCGVEIPGVFGEEKYKEATWKTLKSRTLTSKS